MIKLEHEKAEVIMDKSEAAEFTRKLLARAEINAFPNKPKLINNIPAFYFYTVLSSLLDTPRPDEEEQKEQTEEVIEMSLVDALGMVIEAAEGWLFHECMDTPEDLAALEIVKEHKADLDGASRQ